MGFIKDFFDRQKAKSIATDYKDIIYLDVSSDNIRSTIDDSEAGIDNTMARLSYFYLIDKCERNALNVVTYYNYCRIKKLPITSYDKWEGVVISAAKDLYNAVNVADVKYIETYLALATYYLGEDKDALVSKVLLRCPLEHSGVAYLRSIVEMNRSNLRECKDILSPYKNDPQLIPMAKILLASSVYSEIGVDASFEILDGIDMELTVEERAEYLYLLTLLGKYSQIIDIVRQTTDPSHYDAYMVCVASYYLGKDTVETGIMDSDMLKENANYLSREIYSPYRYNEVRSNELIEQMRNDDLFDTATPEFRLMRQNELLDTLQVFYNGVRYLEFLDTFVV